MSDTSSSFPVINSRYQILNTIATGGMAIIYYAQDLVLERKVALKVLKKGFSQDEEFKNRFRTEAKASANLVHPNIITIFDFGFDGEHLYLVMEYIDGSNLKTIINQESPISISKALFYLLQATNGIGFAHRSGFVHCDVKPQNMLVSKNEILKITDFGIARALESISDEEKSDVIWGSPYYFAPEQANGKAPSPATDIYSLGIIAYELVVGKLPFLAKDSAELIKMQRSAIPTPPRDLNPNVPDSLNQAILKALSKDPADRFQNGEEFHKVLLLIQQNFQQFSLESKSSIKTDMKPISTRQEDVSNPKTIRFSTIFLAILTLILVGGLIPFWLYVILSINSLNR